MMPPRPRSPRFTQLASLWSVALVALLTVCSGPAAVAADLSLVDFAGEAYSAQKSTVVAEPELEPTSLRIRADLVAGYPGVAFAPPGDGWDLSAYGRVVATVTNAGEKPVVVALRVDNAGDWQTQPWSVAHETIKPGETVELTTILGRADGQAKTGFDSAKVSSVLLFAVRGQGALDLRLAGLRATGEPAPVAAAPAAVATPTGPLALADIAAEGFDPALAFKAKGGDAELTTIGESTVYQIAIAPGSDYPGVSLYPPDGTWDLRGYNGVEATITNTSEHSLSINVRVDNHGANGRQHCNNESLTIAPHQTATIPVTFGRSWRQPGPQIDRQKVTGVLIFTGKQREAASFAVHSIAAVVDVAPMPANQPDVKPVIKRVSVDYPAAIDFEATPAALYDLHGGSITADPDLVIAGEKSLLGDSRQGDRKWFEFVATRPGLLKPGFVYTVTFSYRVVEAEEGATFYAFYRSLGQGWGRWDRGWRNQAHIVTAPGTIHEGQIEAGLTTHGDYQLMLGISGKAQVIVDDIHVVQGAPYTEPDPEHEKVKAIPDTAEDVLRVDFEAQHPGIKLKSWQDVVDGDLAITGTKSLMIDSLESSGEWNAPLSVGHETLVGGYRYYLHLRSRSRAWNGQSANAYIVVKDVTDKHDIVWKRWRGSANVDAWVYTQFDVPADHKATLQVGIFKRGQITIDDLVIRREPLGPRAIDTHVPFVPSDDNLVWREEFDGETLDTTKWRVLHEPRRGGWWHRDDALLDGQGNLALRFRKLGDSFAMGAIDTKGKFAFTYGYVEARMQLPKSAGHWPGVWLMGDSVNAVGNDGRDGTEVDIVECPWLDKDQVSHALHWDGYGIDHQADGRHPEVPGIHEGFHTFAVDWSPAGYIFYVDGKETWRTDAGGVCRNPLYIILSEEMGGWSGNPKDAKNLPDHTLIDYIRVHRDPTQD